MSMPAPGNSILTPVLRRANWAVVASFVLTAGAATPTWAAFTLINPRAEVQIGGFPLGFTFKDDPFFARLDATAAAGELRAVSDLGTGQLRAFAEYNSYSPVSQVAGASLSWTFLNTGPGPITLPGGALSARVTSFFSQSTTLNNGSATNEFSALLYVTGQGGFGAAQVISSIELNSGLPPTVSHVSSASPSSSSVINSGGIGVVDATLSFQNALTLAPGASFSFLLDIDAGAQATGDWGAVTDAFRSANLSLRLPVGVSLDSPIPLAWVTTVPVPVPSMAWMLLASVGTLALGSRFRSRIDQREAKAA